MFMEIVKSVTKTTITSTMIFISVVRLGMIAYPVAPDVQYSTAAMEQPVVQSQVTSPETKRRIVLGKNSIGNLGKSK
jgi:hypothetical protein